MQNQLNRTEVQAITSAQSLASVHTLLKAGLGCITFMRDLLPNDNFSESHFVTGDEGPQSSDSFSSLDLRQKRGMNVNVNGFRIMTMTRGYTDEADRLLNYLEHGVFEALEKNYLKTFIFAVYLDSKDPNNIVEAYTFNFQYHTLSGTNTTIPVMTLESGGKNSPVKRRKDPVAEAVSQGKLPTLRDVKRSVKTLLKTLITSMTQMDVLPKRRFASFKMFYTDETPSDYEPPYFQAADANKDKWFFMTHDLDEVPDQWNIGKVDTGHHAVNVSVTSIATFLPSSTEHDNAPFAGTTIRRNGPQPTLTPSEEASLRIEQASKQKDDAEARNVVWGVEELSNVDADGEEDPDFVQQKDGGFLPQASHLDLRPPVPLGVRNKNTGEIEPIPTDTTNLMDIDATVDDAVFGGTTQAIPMQLKDMLVKNTDFSMIDATQAVEQTPTPQPIRSKQYNDDLLNFSPRRRSTSEIGTPCPVSGSVPYNDDDFDGQLLQKLNLNNDTIEDSMMLDLETQAPFNRYEESVPPESIRSYAASPEPQSTHSKKPGPELAPMTPKRPTKANVNDGVVECECGSTMDDASSLCESCNRWYHVWCMGYHSAQDPKLPDHFKCFDCRVRADASWELIKVNMYSTIMSKFKDLASFRRSIKIAEKYNTETAAQFTKAMGCESNLGKQLFKRLEQENFIQEQELVIDDIGFAESRARGKGRGRGRGKAPKNRRNVQKSRFVFNFQMKQSKEYSDYFNPDAECELLGLSATTSKKRQAHPAQDSQTQLDPETQQVLESADTSKRSRAEDVSRPRKKVKISIAPAVDLAE